jgi:hypothetical protein
MQKLEIDSLRSLVVTWGFLLSSIQTSASLLI